MPPKMIYPPVLVGLVGVSDIFVRFRVTIGSTRVGRNEIDSWAVSFRRRVLIRARHQRTRRAKYHNRYQMNSMFFHG
jgi:hypothetical protein